MDLNLFEFQWYKDPKGYSIDTDGVGVGTRLLTGAGRIVRKSHQKLLFYNVYEHAPGLHREFAAIEQTGEAALDFINRFGFLEDDYVSDKEAESLATFFLHQQKVKEALDFINIDKNEDPGIAAFIYNGFSCPDMTVRFNLERPNVPTLKIIPTSLISYIWLCLADEITQGRNYKYCRNCNKPFAVGKNTGRTSKSEYCAGKCKKAWHRKQEGEA